MAKWAQTSHFHTTFLCITVVVGFSVLPRLFAVAECYDEVGYFGGWMGDGSR